MVSTLRDDIKDFLRRRLGETMGITFNLDLKFLTFVVLCRLLSDLTIITKGIA